MLNKLFKRTFAGLAVIVCAIALVGCKNKDNPDKPVGGGEEVEKVYTYNTYTGVSPSNWNELTYQDSNDTQIMSYIGSAFFEYDFKYDANGNILPGEYEVEYSAATKLEDVSEEYYGEGAYALAYKITLREDLKWDDGTPIKAEDFVYTMKEQLDPKAKHYRADSFYVGGTIIHNAEMYVNQGSDYLFDNANSGKVASKADLVKGADGVYNVDSAKWAKFAIKAKSAWCGGNSLADYAGAGYIDNMEDFAKLAALCDENGYVAITDESIALLEAVLEKSPSWGENASYLPNYIQYEAPIPEMDFSEVGIHVGDTPYELVVVLDKQLPLLKEDGSLDYTAAYNFSSLPLVHRAKWEANKVAPTAGTDLWTSTYNSSVASSASWGPYKLVSFQSGKEYVLERNANWYGYNMEKYEGQYQTDRIVCETIAEWNTAWLKFLAGEIDSIGIDVSIADEYKGSAQAYFTPDDYVGSMQLQSSKEALKARETEGVNKTILTYAEFRKAISLSVDRADYAKKCTTSSLAGFGLYNSMHYYDVANGGVFRNTDEAKKVLCNVYNVDYTQYESLDAAVASITGYDPVAAKALVESAYSQALAAGDIKATDKVVLTFGTSVINESTQRQFDYLSTALAEMVKGTALEGRLECELKNFGDAWANDFRAGAYDVCTGGWSGAAWDPGYFLLAYLSPSYMYSAAWDTSAQMMTFTMKGVGKNGEDITDTMSLIDWYNCLNGASGAKYNFSSAALEESQRLQLIAALEEQVLLAYYTVPMYNYFSAALMSYKTDYVTYEYNTFMGYGGIRYMTYNYSDAEWADAVAAEGGELIYK